MRGLNGNEAAQPRVFAHDMVPIAIGAINPRQQGTGATLNGVANGLEMTSGGATHAIGNVITLSAGSGTVAVKVKVLAVNNGAVTDFALEFSGTTNAPYGAG